MAERSSTRAERRRKARRTTNKKPSTGPGLFDRYPKHNPQTHTRTYSGPRGRQTSSDRQREAMGPVIDKAVHNALQSIKTTFLGGKKESFKPPFKDRPINTTPEQRAYADRMTINAPSRKGPMHLRPLGKGTGRKRLSSPSRGGKK